MNIVKFLFQLLLGRRLPTTAGTLEVPGIGHPVVIRRDQYGIPYIEAQGDDDAWYGLGFCHGQDRAFQIEGNLRAVRGTVAELVGPAALPVDRLCRRVGFYRAAKQQVEVLDKDVRRMLEAYARGVTDGAKLGCPRLAHEFALLRAKPTPYSATDIVGVIKLMSFNLMTNWDCELMRLKTLTEDGPEALAALDPKTPEWLHVANPPMAFAGGVVDRLAEDLAIFTTTVDQGGGSNNWAIAPSRTSTGRPILANDPHLAPVLPPYMYLAHVRTPDWAIAGASFVGAPVFVSGHNGTAAWGMTSGMLDNTDLFIEEIGPDGQSVRQGDGFVSCEVRREVIQVKGGEPVEEEVLVTPRGPIIGPALEGEMGAISIRATWLDNRPVRGLFSLHRVRSFEEFHQAFEQWPVLPLNMAYADASGTIGWQLVGDAPLRRKGWGTIPLPGWDPQVGWQGLVPYDEVPHATDPEKGFIATANTKPTPSGEGPFLGVDWLDGYRLTNIVRALDARRDWDVAGVQALQLDQASIPWQEMRDAILGIPAEADEVGQALTLLEAWDGVLAADSPAAAVFEFFVIEMTQRVVRAKAPKAARWSLGGGCTPLAPRTFLAVRHFGRLVCLVREQPEGWFERPWAGEMADALVTVMTALREQYGDDPAGWAWGHLRQLTLRHSVGGQAPLDRVFNLGPIPCGGDCSTIAHASVDPFDPAANPIFTACLRMVIDVGKWDESRFALPGGQSGNPLSPHYGDQLPFWQRGEGVTIAWSSEATERATRSVLRLEPTA